MALLLAVVLHLFFFVSYVVRVYVGVDATVVAVVVVAVVTVYVTVDSVYVYSLLVVTLLAL